MRELVLIAHNVRSTHNVGSFLRTCDGLGVGRVLLTGYSPYPAGSANDSRLPHIAIKLDKQISKTALGAEKTINWQHYDEIGPALTELRSQGFTIAALEQTTDSVPLGGFTGADKLAIIVGREVEGIEPEVLALCDIAIEIPMHGQKESFNVAIAAAIALYQLSTS